MTTETGTEQDEPLPDIQTEAEFFELIEDNRKAVTSSYRHATTDEVRLSYSDDIQNMMRLQGIANDLKDGKITLQEAKKRATDTDDK